MTPKLREFYSVFSDSLGVTPLAAYELQRSFQGDEHAAAEGFVPGRNGPGGGTDASAFNVAFMLIGLFVDVPRAGASEATWRYHNAPALGSVMSEWENVDGGSQLGLAYCPMTLAPVFGQALRRLLSDPKRAMLVDRIEIDRNVADASIFYRDGRKVARSRFINPSDIRKADANRARTVTTLPGKLFATMATAIWQDASVNA